MQVIRFNTSTCYDVFVGSDILKNSGNIINNIKKYQKAVVVTDDIVDGLYSQTVVKSLSSVGIKTSVFAFKNGEESKCHNTLLNLYDFLVDEGITRSDLLIALGGGVVGDLTGFAAATYLRGIDVVQIPTTLLAQTDSSLGGKTAVDINKGKNLIGAFKQPLCVITDTDTLKTLSKEIFEDGMAEIIKYGMIKSRELFDLLKDGNANDKLDVIIPMCINIKREIVEGDELDKGERMLLNFGHTLGHSIEKYYNFTEISHGRAVGIGMAVLTDFSVKNRICQQDVYNQLVSCLKKYKLDFNTDIGIQKLMSATLADKKRDGDYINIILCREVGVSYIKKMTINEFYKFMEAKDD